MGVVIAGIWRGRGTREELGELVQEVRPNIFRLALSITASRDLAEDVTQEVCCRVLKSRAKLADVTSPWAWIRKVTVNCAITAISHRVDEAAPEDTFASSPDRDEALAVAQVLGLLSTDHRTILALAIYEGLSYAEISDTLDIPPGSVASRLHNAKERFRKLWEDER